jgi:lysozyme
VRDHGLVAGDQVEVGASSDLPAGRPVRIRHRLVVALAVVAALMLAAGALWEFWLPSYRPSLRPGEVYGVDVSNYQGRIDWQQVARDQVSFAYIKATEGARFVDAAFSANWSGATKAGLAHGAYHFFTLCASGEQQAGNFLRTVPRDPSALPAAIDLELAGNCSLRPTDVAVRAQVTRFLDLVEQATGHPVVVYLGADFARTYALDLGPRRLRWVRHLVTRPPDGTWLIWQVSDIAQVTGISTRVDLDVQTAP